ncbi:MULTISPECIES: hypothetical protein [Pseudoalteromonas]|uniref:Uncharacterized protein n=1 Tax=Pseudoalteromonas piscicida TaxID=43662 RepID=A0AAD0W6D9_PSEO7|nr:MULTISPECIES: hypothetical protein [Pseudoalteromonas]ASD68800.1 hypothetical protein B1L02_18390 [Pseudoalteromonas piscicida]AUJ71756.1 hypothetical protein PNC201_17695 [Pseudoalteromonas sp. NC201]AXR03858.1 hypothetical protein D0511_18470 [Pseudoalteromonas piscicida]MBR8845649.1 hypothetical protein [Pseudoalteromonas sp. JC3]MCF2828723.1 hypothetical protein [Pseudoalteromonas sp. OF5H-5]
MKDLHQNMQDVTEAKELLVKVEGGLSPIKFPGDDKLPPCDWWVCPQPLYGVIIDPPFEKF